MSTYCYLNGDMVALEDAKISVLDRGFIFGEGIYEVIPIMKGRPFFLNDHLERLSANLVDARINNPHTFFEWKNLISSLTEINKIKNCKLYIQVTRGAFERNHGYPSTSSVPTVFAMTSPLTLAQRPTSLKAVTLLDDRWERCKIKNTSLYANTQLKSHAHLLGADEALLHKHGFITEGASSSVFFVVEKNIVLTPPLSQNILPGITRKVVLMLLKKLKLKYSESKVSLKDARGAKEIWLASSSNGISCVKDLDCVVIGDGMSFPVATRVYKTLIEMMSSKS